MFFDINAKLDEQKKGVNETVLGFNILISTKPSIVKYSVAGTVTMEGSAADIKKKLEQNPKTKIPQILFAIYQDVFNSIYILASILNAPYPPPDLLHPMAEKIQIQPNTPPPATTETPAQTPTQAPAGNSQPAPPASTPAPTPAPTQPQPAPAPTSNPAPTETPQTNTTETPTPTPTQAQPQAAPEATPTATAEEPKQTA